MKEKKYKQNLFKNLKMVMNISIFQKVYFWVTIQRENLILNKLKNLCNGMIKHIDQKVQQKSIEKNQKKKKWRNLNKCLNNRNV